MRGLWKRTGGAEKQNYCSGFQVQVRFICKYAIIVLSLFTFNHFTFTFNHLADAFIQSDVQMRRTIEAIRPSREQQYTSALTSLS